MLPAVALVLAACVGGAPTLAPTIAPATVAPATIAPPTVPPATLAPPTLAPGFSLPSADKELEGLLPDQIAGEAVGKSSVGGEALVAGPGGDAYQRVLTALDKKPSDLSAAIGSTEDVLLLAFRIKGVEADAFFDAYLEAAAAEPDAQPTDVTVAGKPAKRFTDATGQTLYVYFVDGASITVSQSEPDTAVLTEIFEKLP
jgi:hypothetical protein